jgi:ribosome biogenesis GTPase
VLAGEERAAVKEVREDDAHGRHTTTRRQLHLLPNGGLILDTPGMRELAVWDAEGVEQSFPDIDELVRSCSYSNCQHNGEAGCAIAAGLSTGSLDAARYAAWRKLEREARHQVRRVNALARADERRKWKAIGKAVAKRMEAKYGRDGW